jgi:DNA repair protein RadC
MGNIKGFLNQEMPREKLINLGPNSLTEVELLAILLRTGTKDKNVLELSREILSKFTINQVSRRMYQELLNFNGIKEAKATTIVSAFELARRLSNQKEITKLKLLNSKDVYNFIKEDFNNLSYEKVGIVFIDSKNGVIKKEILFEGSVNYSVIDSRIILKKALIYDASGFFLIHNHPSGDSTPSKEDIDVTNEIKKKADDLEIRFLDHIIIGDEYFSIFDNELM